MKPTSVTSTHYIFGSKKYDRVTSVFSIMAGREYLERFAAKEKAELSTHFHAICALENKGKLNDSIIRGMNATRPELSIPLQAFLDWKKKEKPKIIGAEETFKSDILRIAGTPDFLYEKNGDLYVPDIKLTNKIVAENIMQTAAYAKLVMENPVMKKRYKNVYRQILRFDVEKGLVESPDYKPKTLSKDWLAYLNALSLYRMMPTIL